MNLPSHGPKTSPPLVLTAGGKDAAPFFALRHVFAGLFVLAAPEREGEKSPPDFVARVASQFILSNMNSPSLHLARAATASAGGSWAGYGLRLQLSGEARGQAGDRDFELGADDLLFFDLQQSLDLRIAAGRDGARDVTLWVPRVRTLAAFDRDDLLHGLVLSGGSPAGAMLGGGLKILAEQAETISIREIDALCDGLIALAAKALGPVLATPRASVLSPAAAFVTIRRYIDRNLRSPNLYADKLADTFGISRASLYRLFEPVGGVAVYIRTARLNLAYQEITENDFSSRRIGPIAFSLGFKNVSAFNRTFREHFGMSPREARAKAMSAAPPSLLVAPEGVMDETRTLGFWLARIGAPAGAPAGPSK